MKPRTVSVAWLRKHDACKEQVRIYAKAFRRGEVRLTAARIRKAAALGLDLNWYAGRALDAQAWAAHNAACAQAWAAYNAACAQALTAYDAACAQALTAYDAACAQALTAYNAACAQALIKALGLKER